MTQMTPAQARVIDPILTEVARGYRSNNSPVANVLFPVVPVGQRGGRIISFGPDDFKLINSARAPGSNTKRIQFGYSSSNFSLVDYRLEGAVPRQLLQEAQAVPGIDLASNAVRKVRNMQELEREKQAADLARDAGSYASSNKITLAGADQWSHSSGGDPFGVIEAGKEAVRASIGQRPNVLVLSPKALTSLRRNVKVLDRLSTAKDRAPATMEQLAALFEVPTIVEAAAIMHDGTAFSDVWGKDALLAYTTPASLAEMGSPNYGYTYQLQGMPMTEEGYYDNNTETWYYPVSDARQPVLAGALAGYLITAAVA
jgi:hypothetical protein